MTENPNPILDDEVMFEWLLLKAVKLIDLSELDSKYSFATEEGLELYTKISPHALQGGSEIRRKSNGFIISVLQVMGILSILDEKMISRKDDIEGSNVIDFIKHQIKRNKSQSYLKQRKVR